MTQKAAYSVSGSIGFISSGSEEVVTLVRRKQAAYGSDSLPKVVIGTCRGLPNEGLQLRKGHFYGVEIRAVFRKEEEPCADVLEDLLSHSTFMGWQIVEDHDVPFTQCRCQDAFDVKLEHLPIHRPIHHASGIDPIMSQTCDECLSVPAPCGSMLDQPFPELGPSAGLCHVGLEAGFIDKDEPFQMVAHEGLATRNPDGPVPRHIGPLLFAGPQIFFYARARAGAASRPQRNGAP